MSGVKKQSANHPFRLLEHKNLFVSIFLSKHFLKLNFELGHNNRDKKFFAQYQANKRDSLSDAL